MHSRLFRVALPVLLFVTEVVAQQHTSTHSQLDQYVEQVSELSSRARANVYFTNPQSIFRGVQVNFVNVGTGNLTFLRRDLVTSGRIPLVFARVYDSSGRGSVEFGPGWTLSAAETIVVSESRAQLLGENGSPIDFAKTADREFKLEKHFPSDYSSLRMIDQQTIETSLRTGFTKQFQLINGVFRLTRVTDRNGNSVRLSYRHGLLARIANENHSVTISRDGKGRIISAQDDSNRRIQFSYDSKGRLIEADDLGGQPWTYQYNDDDTLLNARDPLQRLNFGASFDDTGHVRRLQLPSGSIQFDFNPVTHITTITDRRNLVSRFFQNDDGITVRVTNPLNEETAIGLDEARNVISLVAKRCCG